MNLIKKISNKLCRIWINQRLRKRLNQHHFSVVSSNCVGALMLHDLGEQFRSPFVNLYLMPKDFIRYLQNIEHYQQLELVFPLQEKTYPVGKLGDLTLHFMHYHSVQEAKEKWQARNKRLNVDQLFIIMTDRDGCTLDDLKAFDALPFKNKVVFTHKAYPEIRSAFWIKGFENQHQVGDLFAFSGWFGKKYYDQFDYVAWFNQI